MTDTHLTQLLGDRPPKIKLAQNDAGHAAAHTLERHGPDVPLRRSDASPGQRTIEGCIYGNVPWHRPERFSYRWSDHGTLNRTVNEFVQVRWTEIRAALATSGAYQEMFNAGHAIGEGFRDRGPSGAPDATYGQTSLVTVTIELAPGHSPPFLIVRAFPNGRGY